MPRSSYWALTTLRLSWPTEPPPESNNARPAQTRPATRLALR